MSEQGVPTSRAHDAWMSKLSPEKMAEIASEQDAFDRGRELLTSIAPEMVAIATRIRPDWPALTFDMFARDLWSILLSEAAAQGVVREETGPTEAPDYDLGRPRVRALIETAVYRAFDAAGVLLYVGITNSPKTRMRGHEKTSEWWPEMQSVTFEWCASREEAEELERNLVASLCPPFNTAMNPEARR